MAKLNLSRSWTSQPLAMRVIRLWLGLTWIYGGWNKATDNGFLDPASPHYIGAQMKGYMLSSPLHALLQKGMEHATLIGWATIFAEFAIGIACLAGVALELVSLLGFGMSIGLWLTATWSVKPYFLGSDTAYAVLWIALFLSLRQSARSKRITSIIPDLRDRREVMQLVGVSVASIAAIFIGKKFQVANVNPEMGTPIATLASLPVGGNKNFQAADGSAAIVFRTNSGVYAYSRVCTHQGCIVDWDSGTKTLLCPCHGAQFDPAKNGAAVAGPSKIPVAKIKVAIKGNNIVQI